MKITKLKKKAAGFTLVELVIVIAIVIVLSVVSVPIYRSYVDKAKMTEGYALLATILSAQKAYFSEHGRFLRYTLDTNYNEVLGVDARGNKYFTWFNAGDNGIGGLYYFEAYAYKPIELQENGTSRLWIQYSITRGAMIREADSWDPSWT